MGKSDSHGHRLRGRPRSSVDTVRILAPASSWRNHANGCAHAGALPDRPVAGARVLHRRGRRAAVAASVGVALRVPNREVVAVRDIARAFRTGISHRYLRATQAMSPRTSSPTSARKASMIAVGVASPSASGQVMTTTLIANSSDTPRTVRPPCRSRASWPLQVQNVDSIHWRTGPSDPCRRRMRARAPYPHDRVARSIARTVTSHRGSYHRMPRVASLAMSSGVLGARDRGMVVRGLCGRGLLQRIADAAGDIAAGAFKAALLDEALQLRDRCELRVIGDRRGLSRRVGVDVDHPRLRP
jgi:hypothetical protein